MNGCEAVITALDEYLDGELPAEERLGFEAHVRGCKACATQLQLYRDMASAIKDAPRKPAPASILEGVRKGIAAEGPLNQRPVLQVVSAPPKAAPENPFLRGKGLLLLSAAAMLMLGCLLVFVTSSTRTPNGIAKIPETAQPVPAPATQTAPAAPLMVKPAADVNNGKRAEDRKENSERFKTKKEEKRETDSDDGAELGDVPPGAKKYKLNSEENFFASEPGKLEKAPEQQKVQNTSDLPESRFNKEAPQSRAGRTPPPGELVPGSAKEEVRQERGVDTTARAQSQNHRTDEPKPVLEAAPPAPAAPLSNALEGRLAQKAGKDRDAEAPIKGKLLLGGRKEGGADSKPTDKNVFVQAETKTAQGVVEEKLKELQAEKSKNLRLLDEVKNEVAAGAPTPKPAVAPVPAATPTPDAAKAPVAAPAPAKAAPAEAAAFEATAESNVAQLAAKPGEVFKKAAGEALAKVKSAPDENSNAVAPLDGKTVPASKAFESPNYWRIKTQNPDDLQTKLAALLADSGGTLTVADERQAHVLIGADLENTVPKGADAVRREAGTKSKSSDKAEKKKREVEKKAANVSSAEPSQNGELAADQLEAEKQAKSREVIPLEPAAKALGEKAKEEELAAGKDPVAQPQASAAVGSAGNAQATPPVQPAQNAPMAGVASATPVLAKASRRWILHVPAARKAAVLAGLERLGVREVPPPATDAKAGTRSRLSAEKAEANSDPNQWITLVVEGVEP